MNEPRGAIFFIFLHTLEEDETVFYLGPGEV